jgi:Family of unknown function (DUF6152)
MRNRIVQNGIANALLVVATGWLSVASAHHSFATFDENHAVTLVGVVKEVQWTNPHIWVEVLVKSPDNGQDVQWSIEGGSPNGLNRAGWKRTSIKAGDAIEITIHPLKDGSHGGSMMTVKVNGQPIGRRL